MKLHTPLIMGALIFTGNLTVQAASTSAGEIDILRSVAMATLAGIISFIVAPLLGFGDTMDDFSEALPIEPKPEQGSSKRA